ncbi:MAG: PDDEXK nuclease domain-containing protein [Euryarchaeota archaeon]|nr:PDDEXK nuclease domain-containing protein [Euryarchaeota archaeon]
MECRLLPSKQPIFKRRSRPSIGVDGTDNQGSIHLRLHRDRKGAKEQELENALVEKIRDLPLELAMGFAFMERQYHPEVDGRDFYPDLLFYHHRLRCLVAIDLKIVDFMPEYSGKINFYLSALDEMMLHPDDRSSVGIILCKSKGGLVSEYSLMDMSEPIGVSEYWFTSGLPDGLSGQLPKSAGIGRGSGRGGGEGEGK